RTRVRVGSATISGRFSTLETVPTETPACAATSLMLAGASATVPSRIVVQVCGARLERVKHPGGSAGRPARAASRSSGCTHSPTPLSALDTHAAGADTSAHL